MIPDIGTLREMAGLPGLLGAAYVGGLLLSLTPCVYPMIPVTVAAFGARTLSRPRALVHGVLYVLGIAVTYASLGAWAAATGRIFGASLADPRVAGGFALALGAFAVVSFGWWPALERLLSRTPGFALRIGGASPGGALAMGLVAGIVFAPCVGPFVAGVLTYVAATGDVPLGASLLGVVAIGMGTPFLALAMTASELRRLPRVGALPEVARFALGLLLLAAAFYFARLALPPPVFGGLLVLALAGLGFERLVRGRRVGSLGWRAVGATALVLAMALTGYRFGPAAPAEPLAWRSDVDVALAEARDAGRFAVVDFTADWCLACHELDRLTFRDPAVARLLARAVRVRIDATRTTETVEALFARFGVYGLPAVVVLDPVGRIVEDARIASFIGPDEAVELLERAGLGGDDAPAAMLDRQPDDHPEESST